MVVYSFEFEGDIGLKRVKILELQSSCIYRHSKYAIQDGALNSCLHKENKKPNIHINLTRQNNLRFTSNVSQGKKKQQKLPKNLRRKINYINIENSQHLRPQQMQKHRLQIYLTP